MIKNFASKIFGRINRKEIDNKTRRLIAIIITAISTAAIVCLIILIFHDVSSIISKSQTNNILSQNSENIPTLKSNINALKTDANLLRLVSKPDNSALDVILEALPTTEDSTELAAIVQKNIFEDMDVKVNQITVTEKQQASGDSADIGTTGISFSIVGSFDLVTKAIRRLESSIRPIIIETVVISKLDGVFTAEITALTYYAPETKFAADMIVLPDIKKPSEKVFGEKAINLRKPVFVKGK